MSEKQSAWQEWIAEATEVSGGLNKIADRLQLAATFFQTALPKTSMDLLNLALDITMLNNKMMAAVKKGIDSHNEIINKQSDVLKKCNEVFETLLSKVETSKAIVQKDGATLH